MSTFAFGMIGLLTGLGIGSTAGICYYRRSLRKSAELSVIREIAVRLHTLISLREGDLETAVKRNEDTLDGSIILLGSMLRSMSNERRHEHQYALQQIRAAKEYRQKYPQKRMSPIFDRDIAECLSYADSDKPVA
jgi:hypothetical protein